MASRPFLASPGVYLGRLLVVPRAAFDDAQADGLRRLTRGGAWAHQRALFEGPFGRGYYDLVRLYEEGLGERLRAPPDRDDVERMVARVRRAFDDGELVAFDVGGLVAFERPGGRGAEGGENDGPPAEAAVKAPPPEAERADATSWFELRVVDETGQPVPGLEVRFTGGPLVATDGDGVARWQGAPVGISAARLASVAAAREALRPRWQAPRRARGWVGAADTSVHELDGGPPSVALRGEKRHTLVLTPYFCCTEVPGAHFDFGRSFPRPDALPALAGVARSLSADPGRKAMLYGHTDKAGTEALNKSLSEKRARALFALLTHDADSWEAMWAGRDGDEHWREAWGARQTKAMLNALGCPDDEGRPLAENGVEDGAYRQAVKRFQGGAYAKKPAAQAPLAGDGIVGPKTRREMFLAYAKQAIERPIEAGRFTRFGAAPYMGCGEYNPLHASAQDAPSRRAVAFVYDAAAEPQGLPCRVGTVAPCRALVAPEAPAGAPPPPDGPGKPKTPYRCPVYQEIATKCPCAGGAAEPLLWRVRTNDRSASDEPLHLAVRDILSKEQSRLEPLSGGRDEATFDLSALDPSRTYELTALRGERALFLPCQTQVAALRLALAHDDADALVRAYGYEAGEAGVSPLVSESPDDTNAPPGSGPTSLGWIEEV